MKNPLILGGEKSQTEVASSDHTSCHSFDASSRNVNHNWDMRSTLAGLLVSAGLELLKQNSFSLSS
ncbi:MAG: hypothetical protein WBE34_06190 [Candidatus Nitrosopolaris sp.]